MTAQVIRLHRYPANRQPSRWNPTTCGVPNCPCPHEPPTCDRGWTSPNPSGTTSGVTTDNRQISTGHQPTPDTVRRCPTCATHARARADAETAEHRNTLERELAALAIERRQRKITTAEQRNGPIPSENPSTDPTPPPTSERTP